MLGDTFTHRFHDLQVDAQQVVTAHTGLACHPGGDDADIGARNIGVVLGARQGGVEALGRARFGDVERFALGEALCNVKEDNVPQFFQRGEMGERAADIACADEGDLGSSH